MRIYEGAKLFGISNKELVKILKDAGFKVQSHMSLLSDEAFNFLEKKFTKGTKEEPADIEEEKQEGLIIKAMTLGEFSSKSGISANEIILNLLKQGYLYNINQILPEKIIMNLASFYGIPTLKPKKVENVLKKIQEKEKKIGGGFSRMPVVAIVGHVDHGKTTLLDYIRKTRVVSKEKGGITQHLAAYKATTSHGNIVFIDTPGHEAFSKMRARGVKVADIVVLVVAADDGVMPQTIEAIKYARSIEAPIIVALNKIDKAAPAQIEAAKNSLAKNGLIIEEWGGDVICAPISAKTGEGVDELLEMISLQSQLMDLGASIDRPAQGYVLEVKLKKGIGPVATVIMHDGVLRVGDYFICGNITGKVNLLIDSYGKKIRSANPSEPVLIGGFDELPEVGALLRSAPFEEYKKFKSKNKNFDNLLIEKSSSEGSVNLIVKVDGKATREALLDSLKKIGRKYGRSLNIVKASVGDITEGDIILAEDTGAIILGLHVKPESNARILAKQKGIKIQLFDIIYKLLEEFEKYLESTKKIEYIEKKIGEAIVRKVFKTKTSGVIAGCYIKSGFFTINAKVYVYRGNKKIGEGKIKSLQCEKKTEKEVKSGYECGFILDGFNDWKIDDLAECFIMEPKK